VVVSSLGSNSNSMQHSRQIHFPCFTKGNVIPACSAKGLHTNMVHGATSTDIPLLHRTVSLLWLISEKLQQEIPSVRTLYLVVTMHAFSITSCSLEKNLFAVWTASQWIGAIAYTYMSNFLHNQTLLIKEDPNSGYMHVYTWDRCDL